MVVEIFVHCSKSSLLVVLREYLGVIMFGRLK